MSRRSLALPLLLALLSSGTILEAQGVATLVRGRVLLERQAGPAVPSAHTKVALLAEAGEK